MNLNARVAGRGALFSWSSSQSGHHRGIRHRIFTTQINFSQWNGPIKSYAVPVHASAAASSGSEPPTQIQKLSDFLQGNYIPMALISAIILG